MEKPFGKEEVDDILSLVTGDVEESIRRKIVVLVENELRMGLVGLVRMTSLETSGAPQVMLRVRTLQTILDDFRLTLGAKYDESLQRIGRNIGFNFGISLVRILKNYKCVPQTLDALLTFWAKFDSSAQMGKFSFSSVRQDGKNGGVSLSIQDLFLTRGYDGDSPLRHGSFMIGYLEGAFDTASMLWTRWVIKGGTFNPPERLWTIRECHFGKPREADVTEFEMHLQPEAHRELKDLFYDAIQSFELQSWTDAMVTARACIEKALLLRAEEDPNLKFSFARLLTEFDNARVPLESSRWSDVYSECSKYAHGRNLNDKTLYNEVSVSNKLFDVWACLREAELLQVSAEQVNQIKSARTKYKIT